MNEFNLTGRELLYVAALLGAPEFYGIPDPFWGMNRQELTQETARIQDSLLQKNYLSMDFTGKMKIQEDLNQLVTCCAFCDSFFIADLQGENQNNHFWVYFKEGKMALVRDNESEFRLRSCDFEDLQQFIGLVSATQGNSGLAESRRSTIYNEQLELAKRQSLQGDLKAAKQTLAETGLDGKAIQLLLERFMGKCSISSTIYNNFQSNEVTAVLCLTAEDGLCCMMENCEKSDNGWEVEIVAAECYSKKVLDLVRRAVQSC